MCHFTFILLHDGIISYIYNNRAWRMCRLRLKLFPSFNLVLVLAVCTCTVRFPLPRCNQSHLCLHSHIGIAFIFFAGNYYFADVNGIAFATLGVLSTKSGKWQIWCVNSHVLSGIDRSREYMREQKKKKTHTQQRNPLADIFLLRRFFGSCENHQAQKGGFEMMSIHWNKFAFMLFILLLLLFFFVTLMCCFFPPYK